MLRKCLTYLTVLMVIAGLTVTASASTVLPRRDFTEGPTTDQTQTEYVTVILEDPPAASYTGGVRGLAPTRPARGREAGSA